MKFEWRKKEKDLYLPSKTPSLITIPKQKFFVIDGKGNPNSPEFTEKIGVLYSLAYAIRMMPKKGYTPDGYFEYTVYPLEGIWDLTEKGQQSDTFNKDELIYSIMIRQPDFVTDDVVDKAFELVKKKKDNPLLNDVVFKTIEDGLSVQMMHLGSYDNEPESFKQMNKFINENNLEKTVFKHREIYLTDFRRVESSKLKTVLRYMVRYKE
ncbi:GyrI-like domain-containing protein [Clostridiaceae bacterium M8S5]|nr:GyrI-like domain-containing protein [Clostridiaceae bacterium M8S5]